MNASRSLTFCEGSSKKFWQIDLDGSSHTVNFGREGTVG
jgi:predicted DNA-binding WGR domain protein